MNGGRLRRRLPSREGSPGRRCRPHPAPVVFVRFDRDVLDALQASGRGWQVRVNEIVRRAILSGKDWEVPQAGDELPPPAEEGRP